LVHGTGKLGITAEEIVELDFGAANVELEDLKSS
jgi:hypothetical protein